MIKLIVGLGNYGQQYEKTRHNAGFWFVDRLASISNSKWEFDKKINGRKAVLESNQSKIWLLKPETYMNLSGQSVRAMLNYYSIMLDECLIVHDELDFDAGVIRLKIGGGAAGHNGLKSIISNTGSPDFLRLRLGIGRPKNHQNVAEYVLSIASKQDSQNIDSAIEKGVSNLSLIVANEYELAMRELHV